MIRYVLHPGVIRSVNDGDEHYIGLVQLARLYRLPPTSWVADTHGLAARPGLIHLGPMLHAEDYERVAEELEEQR